MHADCGLSRPGGGAGDWAGGERASPCHHLVAPECPPLTLPPTPISAQSLMMDEYGRPFLIIRVSRAGIVAVGWDVGQPKAAARCGSNRCPIKTADARRARLLTGNIVHHQLLLRIECTASCPEPSHRVVQEQDTKHRVKGLDAQKANIAAAKAISRILRSSLGPKGMDKMLQSRDGDVTISECWVSDPG